MINEAMARGESSVLYNGMIAPLVPFALRGAIWYQGESNTGTEMEEYHQLFKDLITGWRTKFDQPDMPFVFAQIANLGIPNKQPVESGMANVREAQRRALEVPHTGMAVTTDIGEWNDIHPLNKKEVARRLAMEAARIAYHDSLVVSSGPLYESMETSGNSIILMPPKAGIPASVRRRNWRLRCCITCSRAMRTSAGSASFPALHGSRRRLQHCRRERLRRHRHRAG